MGPVSHQFFHVADVSNYFRLRVEGIGAEYEIGRIVVGDGDHRRSGSDSDDGFHFGEIEQSGMVLHRSAAGICLYQRVFFFWFEAGAAKRCRVIAWKGLSGGASSARGQT